MGDRMILCILKSFSGLKWVCEWRILRVERQGPLNTSVSRKTPRSDDISQEKLIVGWNELAKLTNLETSSVYWKWNFTANFGVLSLRFDVKALIPQGLTGRPNYFGLLNNLMTLIVCEILREIGETACVTSARSCRGQTLKVPNKREDIAIDFFYKLFGNLKYGTTTNKFGES